MKNPLTVTPPRAPFLSGGPSAYYLDWRSAAIVVAFSASLLLPGLGDATRSMSYHEVLFAQPAKEMLATGNWVLPKIAGVPSTHKPPGTHWMIALVMWLTGSQAAGIVR